MPGIRRRHLLAGFGAAVLASASVSVVWLFPSPPTTITIATAFKGASFDYFGQRYRERLARDNVTVILRDTAGAVENVELLRDPHSGVDAAFVTGGVSDVRQAPGLLSLGGLYYNAFWVFYSSATPIESLPQLKGKRIAVGPKGSGTRRTAERMLGLAGVNDTTATFLPFAGDAAAQAMQDGKVDVVWILGSPQVSGVQSLLHNPGVRLLSFPMTDAFARLFPDVVQLTLPRGVLDIEHNLPPNDVALLATTIKLLIRNDMHPEIVYLLLKTMAEEHSQAGIFQRPGEFPKASDPEFPLAPSAVEFYRNGPSFMQRHVPLWMSVPIQRLIAIVATAIAIALPLVHYLPLVYRWNVRRRLLFWYGRLRALEDSIETSADPADLLAQQIELRRIEEALSSIRFPLAFSDQVYNLRSHVDIVRRRLRPRAPVAMAAE